MRLISIIFIHSIGLLFIFLYLHYYSTSYTFIERVNAYFEKDPSLQIPDSLDFSVGRSTHVTRSKNRRYKVK